MSNMLDLRQRTCRLCSVVLKCYVGIQVDAWFASKLPSSLNALCQTTLDSRESVMSSWTIPEVLQIVRPLLRLRAEKWTYEQRSARLWLLEKKMIPENAEENDDLRRFVDELDRYRVMSTPSSSFVQSGDAIPADRFMVEMKRLLNLKTWSERSVRKMVSCIRGVSCIDMSSSSPEAIEIYSQFHPRWQQYILDHPKIAGQL